MPGTAWGNAVNLDTGLTWLEIELQELFVQAEATPMKPLQVGVHDERETLKALPREDLASRGQHRDLKPLGDNELGQ